MNNSKRLLITLFLIALILNLSDALITIYGLDKGLVNELNPIMGYLIKLNPILCVLVKEIVLSAMLFYIWLNQHRNEKRAFSLTILICMTFLLINIWNISNLYYIEVLS